MVRVAGPRLDQARSHDRGYAIASVGGKSPRTFVIRDSTLRHQFSVWDLLEALSSACCARNLEEHDSDTAGPAMVLNAEPLCPGQAGGQRRLGQRRRNQAGGGDRRRRQTLDGNIGAGNRCRLGMASDAVVPTGDLTIPAGQVVKGSPRSFPETGSVAHPLGSRACSTPQAPHEPVVSPLRTTIRPVDTNGEVGRQVRPPAMGGDRRRRNRLGRSRAH